MARFLWKPESEKNGNLVILTDAPYQTLLIQDANGNIIQGTNDGPSNGYGATVRFDAPGSSFNNVQILSPDGQVVQQVQTGSDRAELNDTNPQAQRFRPGQSGGGATTSNVNGIDFATPNFADFNGLSFDPLTFQQIEAATIEGTDPVDIFGVAAQAGENNRDIILQSFEDSRGITDDLLQQSDESNQIRLSDINDFNAAEQGKAFDSLGADAANAINQGLKNLSSFSEGRLPDALQNEILNQSTRAAQSQQTNITGGGISSSFGQRVENQLSIQQRLGLQNNALNATPSFLANALEIRRGTPQKLVFDANQRLNLQTGIAGQLSSAQTLAPAQAIQSEFQNTANELNTQQFNASSENQANQFNSQGQFQADSANQQADLTVQLEQLYAQQAQNNTEANILNSVFDADRANDRFDQNLALQQEGIAAAQDAQNINAISGLVSTGLGVAAQAGAFDGIFSGASAAATTGATTGTTAATTGAGVFNGGFTGAAGTTGATGTTATAGSGLAGAALTAAGVAAGAYTGAQQFSGLQNAYQGKPLTTPEKAALALPTFGASLVYDDVKAEFDNFFGSGKGEDQQFRDSVRTTLENSGGAIRASAVPDGATVVNGGLDSARGNDSHLVQLANGEYFNIGKDGGEKLQNVGENIDGNTERNYFDVDFSNSLAGDSIKFTNPLSVILGGNTKFTGNLTNAATFTATTPSEVRANIQSIAGGSGINFSAGNQALVQAYDGGTITFDEFLAYTTGWANLWG